MLNSQSVSRGLVVGLVLAVLAACPQPTSTPSPPELDAVPVIAFDAAATQPASSVRAVVPAGTDVGELIYFFTAPLITGFAPNSGSRTDGDSFEVPFMDTTMVVDITRSGGVFTFDGELTDGSGWMQLVYDVPNRTFDYEHAYRIFDEDDVIGWGVDYEFVAYCRMGDVALDTGNAFHGTYDVYVDAVGHDSTASVADNTTIQVELFQAFRGMEVYCGPMTMNNGDSFTGVGTAVYRGWGNGNDPPDRAFTGRPSLSNVASMTTELDALDPVASPGNFEASLLAIFDTESSNYYSLDMDTTPFGGVDFGPLADDNISQADRDAFVGALPTGGWRENTTIPDVQ